jgi:hypothetical protein
MCTEGMGSAQLVCHITQKNTAEHSLRHIRSAMPKFGQVIASVAWICRFVLLRHSTRIKANEGVLSFQSVCHAH